MSIVITPKSAEENNSQVSFPKLKFTKDTFADIIKMIEDGNIIALHSISACRAFHNLDMVNLSARRVVYIDCNSLPGLLGDGELEWYIHNKIPIVRELPLGDVLRYKILEQLEIPHKEYVRLGF
jgi:hypothetical protein